MRRALIGIPNGPKPGTSQKLKGRIRPDLSFSGKSNPRYIDVSNEKLLEHGLILLKQKSKLSDVLWRRYAKMNGLPQCLGGKFRFGSFKKFKERVMTCQSFTL